MNAPRAALRKISAFFEAESGIALGEIKSELILSRVMPRLRELGLSLDAYSQAIERGEMAHERRWLTDRLTTNETYFFREPEHFEHLASYVKTQRATDHFRVWSAACSSGQEAYSVAMTLDRVCTLEGVEIVGTDLSTEMLRKAQQAIYRDARMHLVSAADRRRYFMKGVGRFSEQVRVKPRLRGAVAWRQHNLLGSAQGLGRFDVVFLRNVLIYFDAERRQRILENVVRVIRPGGLLYLGLSESLRGHSLPVEPIARSVWRKSGKAPQRIVAPSET